MSYILPVTLVRVNGRTLDNQLSNAISAQILPLDQHQPIHRVPVNGSSMIVRLFE